MPDNLTAGLSALKALEAASHRDELAFTAYALALRKTAKETRAVIEAAAEVMAGLQGKDFCLYCGEDWNGHQPDCKLVVTDAALSALADVLPKGGE